MATAVVTVGVAVSNETRLAAPGLTPVRANASAGARRSSSTWRVGRNVRGAALAFRGRRRGDLRRNMVAALQKRRTKTAGGEMPCFQKCSRGGGSLGNVKVICQEKLAKWRGWGTQAAPCGGQARAAGQVGQEGGTAGRVRITLWTAMPSTSHARPPPM